MSNIHVYVLWVYLHILVSMSVFTYRPVSCISISISRFLCTLCMQNQKKGCCGVIRGLFSSSTTIIFLIMTITTILSTSTTFSGMTITITSFISSTRISITMITFITTTHIVLSLSVLSQYH